MGSRMEILSHCHFDSIDILEESMCSKPSQQILTHSQVFLDIQSPVAFWKKCTVVGFVKNHFLRYHGCTSTIDFLLETHERELCG